MSPNRIVATLIFSAALVLPATAQDLPAGAAKPVFEKMCTQCHGVEGIVRSKFTRERWTAVVDDMVSRGAKGTDEEIDAVIEYLSANFAKKINVNKATASDFKAVGLTEEESQAVVKYRVEKGILKDFDELSKTPGVAAAKLSALKDRVEF